MLVKILCSRGCGECPQIEQYVNRVIFFAATPFDVRIGVGIGLLLLLALSLIAAVVILVVAVSRHKKSKRTPQRQTTEIAIE